MGMGLPHSSHERLGVSQSEVGEKKVLLGVVPKLPFCVSSTGAEHG